MHLFIFTASNSWLRQSNASESFISKTPKTLPLSTDLFHISSITRRHYLALNLFQKLHCRFENKLWKKVDIWTKIFFQRFCHFLLEVNKNKRFCYSLFSCAKPIYVISCGPKNAPVQPNCKILWASKSL